MDLTFVLLLLAEGVELSVVVPEEVAGAWSIERRLEYHGFLLTFRELNSVVVQYPVCLNWEIVI